MQHHIATPIYGPFIDAPTHTQYNKTNHTQCTLQLPTYRHITQTKSLNFIIAYIKKHIKLIFIRNHSTEDHTRTKQPLILHPAHIVSCCPETLYCCSSLVNLFSTLALTVMLECVYVLCMYKVRILYSYTYGWFQCCAQ